MKPSYVYLASYQADAELPSHVDREQCQYTVALCVDFTPEPSCETSWPLQLDSPDGRIFVYQAIGDALVYKGREIPHSRDPLRRAHVDIAVLPLRRRGLLGPPRLTASTYANLRITEARLLAEYMVNTNVLLERGNTGFAAYMRERGWRDNPAVALARAKFAQPYVLFHSWLPGMIELSPGEASVVADLLIGGDVAVGPRHAVMTRSLEQIGWLEDVPVDIDQVARTTATVFLAIQNLVELRRFLRCAAARQPNIVVEIGTARGGMLYTLTQIAARARSSSASTLRVEGTGRAVRERTRAVRKLRPTNQQLHCLLGNSADAATVDALKEIVDGDQSTCSSWTVTTPTTASRPISPRYGPMVAPDGIIALHDICLLPDEWGSWTGVGVLWHELQHACGGALLEIVDPSGVATRERGGAPWSWGIGVLTGRQFAPTA